LIAICSASFSLVVIEAIIPASQAFFKAYVGYIRVNIEAAVLTVLRAWSATLHGLVRISAIGTFGTAA
jgi:uncharacterized membrane protein